MFKLVQHLIVHDDGTSVDIPGGGAALTGVFDAYRATMPESLREFLERYRFVDVALKVVGVGSVGTRCFIIVLQGRDENDPLILQAKEATASVMEPWAMLFSVMAMPARANPMAAAPLSIWRKSTTACATSRAQAAMSGWMSVCDQKCASYSRHKGCTEMSNAPPLSSPRR